MRPFEHLPMPFPCDYDPGPVWFYENIASHLLEDFIKIMDVGLHIDQNAVESLRNTVTTVLADVEARLAANEHIKKYQEIKAGKAQKAHYKKHTQAIRSAEYFLREYVHNSIEHRTAVVNEYLRAEGRENDCKDKWSVASLKKYNIFKNSIFLAKIIDKTVSSKDANVLSGMLKLAERKAELWNRPRYEKANSTANVSPFNPASSEQKKEFFEMLKVTPLAYSNDTGEASWQRDYIIELKKQLSGSDPALENVLDCFIDHSFGGIIRNQFMKAFDSYTIDGVLHGNLRLFGAKSFRPTSNTPNLLNMPSTKSLYAKPLKKCFVAPNAYKREDGITASDDYVIYAIDYSALEDRVIANLSGDVNKQNIFKENLDGHSLNACGYYADEIVKILGMFDTTVDMVKAFMAASSNDVQDIVDLRQKSKGPTFKLAYGGYPDSHKGGVITQDIFDNYHNKLYPGITEYRENYVLKTAVDQGYIHLGLGCRLYTGNPENDIRTLHNATVQFWSILTLIAINELNYRVGAEGKSDDVAVCSTIYDSMYLYVKKDPETIKWVNDNAVEIMCSPYLEHEEVSNEAVGDIGNNWADLHKIPVGASVEDISNILKEL